MLLFALACVVPSPAAISGDVPQAKLVRVYVKTDDGGQQAELAARRESVRDMADALAAKKKTFTVVEREADADVLIEVLDRALYVPKVVMGVGPRIGDPSSIPGMAAPVRSPVLRVRVTQGRTANVFTNKNKDADSARGWKSAAADLAGQIEKWLKTSRQ